VAAGLIYILLMRHDVTEGIMTLAYDIRPEVTLLSVVC
jgi:hypothetical protein